MHYLITGHTGFKGSWLALMLEMQGHTVSGIALDPLEKSLFNQAHCSEIFENDLRIDIRNSQELARAIKKIEPDVIIHLAAQSLVRESYRVPVETFDINVTGTLNVLEATRELKNLKASLIITTDKVYKNHNLLRGYVETDELGGDDPYSASKASADIATQSWIKCFANSPVAIARAGNVVGGGDWAQDRIIPDIVGAYSKNSLPVLRYPDAIRPWQHVLDCLNGYLALINKQLSEGVSGEWNFGPDLSEKNSVGELVTNFANAWGIQSEPWVLDSNSHPHEAGYLLLDSSKARELLTWSDKLSFDKKIQWTVEWYKSLNEESALELTRSQIMSFLKL
jgi:CDP-glucose 4,6-dehydratase